MTTNFRKIFNGASAGFIVAIVIAIVSSANSAFYINNMKKDLQTMYEEDLIGQNSIQTVRVNMIYLDREMKELILHNDIDTQNKSLERIKGYQENVSKHILIAEPTYNTPRNIFLFNKMKATHDQYISMLEDNLRTIKNMKNARANSERIRIDDEMRASFEKLDRILSRLDDIKQQKDITTYKNLLWQNNITLIITFIVLFGTLGIRILILHRNKKSKVIQDYGQEQGKN
jgi:two-component system, sensor histidine kinase and response regulator